MIVDHQAHWYPHSLVASLSSTGPLPRAAANQDGTYRYEAVEGHPWNVPGHFLSLDALLQDMDDHSIDASVVSPNMLGQVDHLERRRAREICESLNELLAAAQRDHPGSIAGLAMLPMQDPDAAVEVLDRAIGELGLKGVCMLSNVDGAPIAGAASDPIFERIAELRVPLFLHPSHDSICHDRLPFPAIEIGLAWMFDTAAAALALVFGGTLDRCPELVVVHPHLGGVVPYVIGRLEETREGFAPTLPGTIREHLRRSFYVDCVSSTPSSLRSAIELYGEDRVLFATDYPWIDRALARPFVTDNLPREQATKVIEENRVPGLTIG
ncbi:MAG: amidohydrolase [Actinobacteria bacterium]|nr:amidohydrolase [Actinomycetota bacterium]